MLANVTSGMGIKYRLDFDGTFSRSRFTQQNRANNADAQRGAIFLNDTQNYADVGLPASPFDYLDIEGIVVVTGTGTLALQWAHQVSNANNLTINNSSSLTANLLP